MTQTQLTVVVVCDFLLTTRLGSKRPERSEHPDTGGWGWMSTGWFRVTQGRAVPRPAAPSDVTSFARASSSSHSVGSENSTGRKHEDR